MLHQLTRGAGPRVVRPEGRININNYYGPPSREARMEIEGNAFNARLFETYLLGGGS